MAVAKVSRHPPVVVIQSGTAAAAAAAKGVVAIVVVERHAERVRRRPISFARCLAAVVVVVVVVVGQVMHDVEPARAGEERVVLEAANADAVGAGRGARGDLDVVVALFTMRPPAR